MSASIQHDLSLVTRFVCTGSENGYHSVQSKPDFIDNTPTLGLILSKEKGLEIVNRLRLIFERRSFVMKDPLLYALAAVVRNTHIRSEHEEDEVRRGAYDLALEVCESPMDLFTFVNFDKVVSSSKKAGWGQGMKRVVRKWYEMRDPNSLASEVTKCKSGKGWTHRDLIRQSHIRPDKRSPGTSVVLNYLIHGRKSLEDCKDSEDDDQAQKVVTYLKAVESLTSLQAAEEKTLIRSVIEEHRLVERQIPTHLFQIKETFEGMLGHMNLGDIFRSIPKMASLGMLDYAAPEASRVIDYVKNVEAIKQHKVHPVVIFLALRRYETNRSRKWIKNHHLVKVLHLAFNASLQNLPRTGKRTLLALHTDSKVNKLRVLGANFLTPITICALMTKFLLQSEEKIQVVYFHERVTELKLGPKSSLPAIVESILKSTREPSNAKHDLAEPLKWALQKKKQFDNILIMSDKKIVSSQQAFHEALKSYRGETSLPNARLALIGLSDQAVLGNRNDLDMLEVSGFNEHIPQLIYNFFGGQMDFFTNDGQSTAGPTTTATVA